MARPRVVFICADRVGDLMAGPAIRAVELAAVLAAAGHPVTVAAPAGSTLARRGIHLSLWTDEASLREAVADAGAVVVFAAVLADNLWLADLDIPLVVDAYDPGLLETLEHRRGEPVNAQRTWVADASRHLIDPLRVADVVLVANDRQRHLVIGLLAATGRIGSRITAEDPALERFVLTVPFGLPVEPPAPERRAARTPSGAFDEDAFVAHWGGGLHSWLDPLALVDALALAARPSLVATFLAGPHPTPVVGEQPLVDQVSERAAAHGLLGSRVVLVEHWVPYADRADWLCSVDVGISLHHRHVETEFSFRTRILDYLWAGLPIICSDGDVFAELVRSAGLGIVVEPGDAAGVAQALLALADEDDTARADRRDRLAAVAAEMVWPRVAAPLLEFCVAPALAADRRLGVRVDDGVVSRLRAALRIARGRG